MFPDMLKKMRKERNLTQDKLADNLGITCRTYGSWERGEHEPDFRALIKIADFYGVSTDYLLGRIEIKKETPPAKVDEGMNRGSVTLPLQPTKEADSAIQALVRKIVRQELGLPDNHQQSTPASDERFSTCSRFQARRVFPSKGKWTVFKEALAVTDSARFPCGR